MNKLELPAEFMPAPCPLADKSPIGFWIRQELETALGSFPHISRANSNRVSSLRIRRFCCPAGAGEGPAWGALMGAKSYPTHTARAESYMGVKEL